MEEPFRNPPDEAGMRQADRHITRASHIALVLSILTGLFAWLVLSYLFDFPVASGDRLAFAAMVMLPLFMCLAVAILMVSTARRHSPRDIGGAAAGPPSPALAIKLAFLQNTLEQVVLAAGIYLVFAAVLGGSWLSILPGSAVLFVTGRILFFRGYHLGVEGRALGMTLTLIPTMLLAVIAVVALVVSWF